MSSATSFGSERARLLLLAVAALVLYLASLDFLPSGDAVYYANIVETRRFDQLTLHQGYYLLGAVFAGIGAWFGASTLASLAVMNAVLGAGLLVVARPLLRELGLSSREAWLGVGVLFLCHRVFVNATTVESYALQTLCVWGALLLFLRRRFVVAGVVFALALWVAPLSVFFAAVFPVVAWRRRWGMVPVLRTAVVAAVVYTPFLAFFHHELLYGVRGLLAYDSHRAAEPGVAAVNFVRFQVKHYGALCLLGVPAVFAVRRHADLGWTTLALLVPNLYVMAKLVGEDHVFFMPLDLVFTAWLVVGATALRARRAGWVAALVVVAQLLVFVRVESNFLRPAHRDVAAHVRAIGAEVASADDPVVIGSWGARMLYVYFNRSAASYPLEAGPLYEHTVNARDVASLDVTGRDVFVLDAYRPSGFAALVRSDASLEARRRALSDRGPVERTLGITCTPVLEGPLTLYRCR